MDDNGLIETQIRVEKNNLTGEVKTTKTHWNHETRKVTETTTVEQIKKTP